MAARKVRATGVPIVDKRDPKAVFIPESRDYLTELDEALERLIAAVAKSDSIGIATARTALEKLVAQVRALGSMSPELKEAVQTVHDYLARLTGGVRVGTGARNFAAEIRQALANLQGAVEAGEITAIEATKAALEALIGEALALDTATSEVIDAVRAAQDYLASLIAPEESGMPSWVLPALFIGGGAVAVYLVTRKKGKR